MLTPFLKVFYNNIIEIQRLFLNVFFRKNLENISPADKLIIVL